MTRTQRGKLAAMVGVAVAMLYCRSASGGNVQVTPEPRMEQRVALSVSRGLQPEFRWSPDSAIGWLHVGRHDKNQMVWEIIAGDSANSIRQPVRYGVAPAGAKTQPLIPLEPGVEYELSVGRYEMYRRAPMMTQIARVRFRADVAQP